MTPATHDAADTRTPADRVAGDVLVVTPGGHDVAVWAELIGSAPRVTVGEVVWRLVDQPRAALLVAGAHPGDETIGLGRFAAQWAVSIGHVSGILATAGEECFDHVIPRPPELADLRLQEWRKATSRLGFDGLIALGIPDGAVQQYRHRLRLELRGLVERRRAAGQDVVLVAPWRHDPHPDHQAVGHAAAQAAHELIVPLIEYGVWMTYWGEPGDIAADGRELVIVEPEPRADAAFGQACAQFNSQLMPFTANLTPVVPAAMMAHHTQQLLVMPADFNAHHHTGDQSA